MESLNAQTQSQKPYAAPRLKVYGSVLELTSASTGPVIEVGNMGMGIMSCYDGLNNGTSMTRKHCV